MGNFQGCGAWNTSLVWLSADVVPPTIVITA